MFPWFKKNRASTQGITAPPSLRVDGNTIVPGPGEQVIALHGELYRKLRKEMDFSPDHIESYFEQLVRDLANRIHALPSSVYGDHREPGGLLGKCLRMGFIAQRIAHGMVVAADLPADARSTAERGWRYAAMIGGLVYPLGVLAHLGAKGGSHGRVWSPEQGPLLEWCTAMGEATYQPYWHNAPRPHVTENGLRLWMLAQLLTAERAAFIVRETEDYLNDLLGVLAGTLDSRALMSQVIERAHTKARLMELGHHRERVQGLPIEDRYDRLKIVVNLAIEESRHQGADAMVRVAGTQLCAFWPRFAQKLRVMAADHDILGFSEEECDEALLLTWLSESGVATTDERGSAIWPMVAVGKVEGPCVEGIVFADHQLSLDGFPLARLVDIEELADTPGQAVEDTPPPASNPTDTVDGDDQERPAASTKKKPPKEKSANPNPMQGKPHKARPAPAAGADHKPNEPTPIKPKAGKQGFPRLGDLGRVLAQASAAKEDLGWWTDKGRALPWPEIAVEAGVAPREFLALLQASGAAVHSSNKQLPLFHDVSYQGQRRTVVIIASEYWDEKS